MNPDSKSGLLPAALLVVSVGCRASELEKETLQEYAARGMNFSNLLVSTTGAEKSGGLFLLKRQR